MGKGARSRWKGVDCNFKMWFTVATLINRRVDVSSKMREMLNDASDWKRVELFTAFFCAGSNASWSHWSIYKGDANVVFISSLKFYDCLYSSAFSFLLARQLTCCSTVSRLCRYWGTSDPRGNHCFCLVQWCEFLSFSVQLWSVFEISIKRKWDWVVSGI